MKILAIDPGMKTGVAHNFKRDFFWTLWDLSTSKGTKKKPAEFIYNRLLKLETSLYQLIIDTGIKPDLIVIEDAKGFSKGKAAVEWSHKFRGVVGLFCAREGILMETIQPGDLKRHATGRGDATKEDMIFGAQGRLGYTGDDDNEADALWLLSWAEKYKSF